jgi:uncharacterized protein involved in exopolysaccharide biosynthesis
MNLDDRLRAASKALKDSSVTQVDAASRLREIVRHTDQPVAHRHTAVLRDEPQESPRPLAPSLPPSGKTSAAAAGRSAAATPHQHWTDGETRSTFHSQSPSGKNAVGRLLGAIWRCKWLIATAVLLGALLSSGWAARQPTLYEGVARVVLAAGSDSTALPGEAPQPPGELEGYLRRQTQLMSSSPVLERAVRLSGSRISVQTLRQRLEVDAAPDADVLTIRVVDSTAKGAAQLANAIPAAYEQVVARRSRDVAAQLLRARSELKTRLAEAEAELARNPNDARLRAECKALTDHDREVLRQLMALERGRPVLAWERAPVPKQPIPPSSGRAMVIGMLLGLLAAAVLVWWRIRGQGPTSRSSAPEQGATSHLT